MYESILDGEATRRKTMITGQLSLFGDEGLEAPRPELPKIRR